MGEELDDSHKQMTDSTLEREVEIDNPRLSDHAVRVSSGGRITIPASIRHRYDIDLEDGEWWVDLTIHKLEKREEDDGGDS